MDTQQEPKCSLEERVAKLEENFHKLDDVLSAFNNAKGAFATLEWMGKTSKVVTPLFVLIGVISFDFKKYWDHLVEFLK